MSSTILRLGTRRSMLAWAQSSWVARQIQRNHPDVKVELVGIETRGDVIQDVSLRSIEGKEFFVAELDQALKMGQVDLTVHSMKDLSLDRPQEFVCAAIPRRESPHDLFLLGPAGQQALVAGNRPLKIGTSSPRRIENIPVFLQQALPHSPNVKLPLQLIEIRGNVNTRLGRVHEDPSSDRHLDGVILALAGLNRLYADDDARPELDRLLKSVRLMVLPLQDSPTNPGQGALAIECRASDLKVRKILESLHDPETERHTGRERALLKLWGGGCHQRFGATSITHSELGDLLYVRGVIPSGEFIEELRWESRDPKPSSKATAWDGTVHRGPMQAAAPTVLPAESALFVAHWRAVSSQIVAGLEGKRVWVSGTSSWKRLAEQGVWVEGCAEGLGFEALGPLFGGQALRLPPLKQWGVLTHDQAKEEWAGRVGSILSTYALQNSKLAPADLEQLKQATDVYWSSGSQFKQFGPQATHSARHACGPGKTVATLRKSGIEPRVFPSVKEWKLWLGI